jgi:hypothetical protein
MAVVASLGAFGLASVIDAPSATAATVTIGQPASGDDSGWVCRGGRSYVQYGASTPGYVVPAGMSELISWSTAANAVWSSSGSVALEVWRPTGGYSDEYSLVAISGPQTVSAVEEVRTFPLDPPIVVQPGDVLGMYLYDAAASFDCALYASGGPQVANSDLLGSPPAVGDVVRHLYRNGPYLLAISAIGELSDATPPSVIVVQASGQLDPTNDAPVYFTATFSESVTGFTDGDVTVTGTAGATSATVVEVAPNNDTTFAVAVAGMTGAGTVVASVGAAVATDAAGNQNTASTSPDNAVTYDPNGPTVLPDVAASPNPAPVGATIGLTATVTDDSTGGSTIHSAEYSLDNGSWTTMAAADGGFDEVSEVAQVNLGPFAAAAVHDACVRGSDAAGNTSGPVCVVIAAYDPSAGFVSGGGWIDSPSGAHTPGDPTDTDVVGKAMFGFVSRYQKGAAVPTGSTQFRFMAADLDFRSTSYDWLVIAGARAQYKGLGTINETGSYRFLLTAKDGAVQGGGGVDTLRVKIWDSAGTVVYDNQPGGSDGDAATDAIEGGSIVIHK